MSVNCVALRCAGGSMTFGLKSARLIRVSSISRSGNPPSSMTQVSYCPNKGEWSHQRILRKCRSNSSRLPNPGSRDEKRRQVGGNGSHRQGAYIGRFFTKRRSKAYHAECREASHCATRDASLHSA